MNLTVEEALRIYPLSRARIVAGSEGVDRIIHSVNVMDAPDITDWIKSGEMLFTTAFAIKDTPEEFLKLIVRLSEGRAAGLGIKLGRYWNEIPETVIEEANRLKFPLLELPYEFTFADQMNALIQFEVEKSTQQLHDALEKQKRLMRFAMQPGDSSQYFEKVAEILRYPIVVIGLRGQLLYNTSEWSEHEILKQWPWNATYAKRRASLGWVCTIPMMQEDECTGYLLVMPDSSQAIQKEEALFHQAAEVLSTHMDRFQDEHQSIDSYRWTLALDRYLHQQLSADQFYEHSALLFPYIDDTVYVCMKTTTRMRSNSLNTKLMRKLRRELKYHPHTQMMKSYHLMHSHDMTTIFMLPNIEAQKLTTMEFSELIHQLLTEIVQDDSYQELRCVLSKPKHRIQLLFEASEECAHALELSEQLNMQRNIVLFADLEFNYIFQNIPPAILSQFSSNLLGPLLQKEEQYIGEMLKTLDAYLEHEASVTDTAKALYVHRNTVLYRIDKMSELLGLDFKKVSHLMQLKLALIFRKLATQAIK